MAELFTVSFTTRKLVKKFDTKGKPTGEIKIDTPVTITALPHATAMSYSGCDNFKIERYEPDTNKRFTAKGSGRDASVGNGTRKIAHTAEGVKKGKELNVVTSGKGVSKIEQAARSGDLAAAINA